MRKKETDTREIYGKEKERETETMDIYNEEQRGRNAGGKKCWREEMLEEDEITEAENAFMKGREMKVGKKKKDLGLEHEDTTSVELAKEECEED